MKYKNEVFYVFLLQNANALNLVIVFSFCGVPKVGKKLKNYLSFHFKVFSDVFQKVPKLQNKTFFTCFFMQVKNEVFYVSLIQNAKCTTSRFFQFLDMPKMQKNQ